MKSSRDLPERISFSKRTNWDLADNLLTSDLRRRRAAGLPIADLTASNPTRCGFKYEAETILAALRDLRALDYDPDPRGWLPARKAICKYYADRDVPATDRAIPPEQVLLTTSTSEAYSFLFRLLCDPGDEVLIMQPSYPLFDFLADLDDVRLVPFPLVYDHGWQIDLHALSDRLTSRTRAIILVHPNNPTGHFTKDWEREALESICSKRGLAMIIDEVFLDYGHERVSGESKSFALWESSNEPASLTFVLSGLSKIAGLPQMKAAWMVCLGPEALRSEAMKRLEMIADTFLSMNAPIQCALPTWLEGRHGIQRQIRERTSGNLAALDQLLNTPNAPSQTISRLQVEAGWYAVLRIPALGPDEETALQLLNAGVWTYPGSYYGFNASGWLVISLLPVPDEFRIGVERLIKLCQEASRVYK